MPRCKHACGFQPWLAPHLLDHCRKWLLLLLMVEVLVLVDVVLELPQELLPK